MFVYLLTGVEWLDSNSNCTCITTSKLIDLCCAISLELFRNNKVFIHFLTGIKWLNAKSNWTCIRTNRLICLCCEMSTCRFSYLAFSHLISILKKKFWYAVMKTPTIRIKLNTSFFNLWLRLPDVTLQEILKLFLRFFTKIQDFLKLKNLFSSISVFLFISNWKEMQSTWTYLQIYLGPQVVCLEHPLFIIRHRLRWTSFCKSEYFHSI